MVRDSLADDETPDVQAVLKALQDPDCQEIIRVLSEPMTAEEISNAAEIPMSTTYRKLEWLTEAALLEEGLEIRTTGQHAKRYVAAFDEVSIQLDADRELIAEVSHEPRTADERLAELWSEVKKEL